MLENVTREYFGKLREGHHKGISIILLPQLIHVVSKLNGMYQAESKGTLDDAGRNCDSELELKNFINYSTGTL